MSPPAPTTPPRKDRQTITPVRHGLFFRAPEALPRGRHSLTREEVRLAHQERLMIAATELLAAAGYRGAGVREICAHAGVSRQAFYDVFADKDECIFAGYDRFIQVLLSRLAVSPKEHELGPRAREIIGAYLDTLQLDLVVARAFQVEIDALGLRARERRRKSLRLFANFIASERERVIQGPRAPLPLSAYVGIVYAVRQLASDALDECEEPDLGALADDVTTWIAHTLRGPTPDEGE